MLFPIFCYLFYIVANKNIDIKHQKLVFRFTLVSTIYLIFRFKLSIMYNFLLLTMPIYLSYKKENIHVSTFLNLLIAILCLTVNVTYFYFFVLELIIIFFNRNKSLARYIFIVCIVSFIYSLVYEFNNIFENSIYILSFIAIANLEYYTIIKGEEIINYHIEYKDLKKEKEIRNSLFKISHEIKNPLAVCKAYVDMFDYDNKECAKKYVPIISSEIDKMLLLLQDFLLVNKDNINFDIMDINVLLEDTVRSMLELHKFKIKLEYIDEDDILINGDYNRLTQVLTNLIKNSYEANADNVILKSYLSDEKVIVEVIDDGDGINDEDYKKIYEPFFTTKKDGTGLGVALSNEIIEAHNGKLEYLKNMSKGTIAKITLPLLEI